MKLRCIVPFSVGYKKFLSHCRLQKSHLVLTHLRVATSQTGGCGYTWLAVPFDKICKLKLWLNRLINSYWVTKPTIFNHNSFDRDCKSFDADELFRYQECIIRWSSLHTRQPRKYNTFLISGNYLPLISCCKTLALLKEFINYLD